MFGLMGKKIVLNSTLKKSYLDLWSGNDEKQFCKIILNFDQWFGRRCRLAILFDRAEQFRQFW